MRRFGLKRRASGKRLGTIPPDPIKRSKPLASPLPLSARQQAFITEYCVDKNATQAAIRAGYAKSGASLQGYRLLRNELIASAIDTTLTSRVARIDMNADRVMRNLADIANGNVADWVTIGPDGAPVVDFRGMTRGKAAALASVTVEEFKDGRSDKREVRRIKFTLADRVKANELLGKHFNLFTERVEHNHHHDLTVMGQLLLEIDQESRGPVIEHDPAE